MVSKDFDLSKLLDFRASYCPNTEFRHWVQMGSVRTVSLLENAATMTMEHHLSLSNILMRLSKD